MRNKLKFKWLFTEKPIERHEGEKTMAEIFRRIISLIFCNFVHPVSQEYSLRG